LIKFFIVGLDLFFTMVKSHFKNMKTLKEIKVKNV